jgi:glycosyltransferase involved in cell wall biosynthesis
VHALCLELGAREDVELRVFAHSRLISRVQHAEKEGVSFTFVPKYEPGRSDPYHLHLPAILQILPLLRRFNPDVVHGFGTESAYGLLAVAQKKPGVVFIQGIQEKLAPFYNMPRIKVAIRKTMERYVVRKADSLIAETSFARGWAQSVSPEANIRVVPHAYTRSFFAASPDFSRKRVICIGALSQVKGCDTVLKAFALGAKRDPEFFSNAELLFIGGGTLEEELKSQARQEGFGEQVRFIGRVPHEQMIYELENARLMIIGSRMDTSPNVITEAHSAAIPVIGSGAGGIPDMIDDGSDGFLFDVDDHETAADHLIRLLHDPSLCKQLGLAGREKVRVLNDPERIATEHIKLYHEVLTNRRG